MMTIIIILKEQQQIEFVYIDCPTLSCWTINISTQYVQQRQI